MRDKRPPALFKTGDMPLWGKDFADQEKKRRGGGDTTKGGKSGRFFNQRSRRRGGGHRDREKGSDFIDSLNPLGGTH